MADSERESYFVKATQLDLSVSQMLGSWLRRMQGHNFYKVLEHLGLFYSVALWTTFSDCPSLLVAQYIKEESQTPLALTAVWQL